MATDAYDYITTASQTKQSGCILYDMLHTTSHIGLYGQLIFQHKPGIYAYKYLNMPFPISLCKTLKYSSSCCWVWLCNGYITDLVGPRDTFNNMFETTSLLPS